MHPSAERQNARGRTYEARAVLPVFAAVVLVIIAFAVFDAALVRVAMHHRLETGRSLYARGEQLRAQGRHSEALEEFRAAYNRSPNNAQYHLAFINALRAVGSEREAQNALQDLLRRTPANGPANIQMARILAQTGEWKDAAWFYHRGLYGEWEQEPDRVELRFELAGLLARHNSKRQLLSEVLLLDAETEGRPEAERRVAELMLAAGSWSRAQELFRSLLRASPDDPVLMAGLARAHFGGGNFRTAELYWRRAAARRPDDAAITQELGLVRKVVQLNPTERRISAAEKHRRSHEIAASLLAALERCTKDAKLVEAAREQLAAHERIRSALAAADADLDLVEQLWNALRSACSPADAVEEPVRLVATEILKLDS